jgi:hypothetical protein
VKPAGLRSCLGNPLGTLAIADHSSFSV